MKKALLLLSAATLLSTGCTHALHQYQAGDVTGNIRSARKISALGEQNGFLGFRFNTDYVNTAWNELQSQCTRGTIEGVNTRFSTSHGFFSWNNQVKMTAYCLEN